MNNLSIDELRNNVKAYRVKNGYTQPDVAKLLGVSISTYKNWERRPNKMTFEKLARLAEIYKCNVKDFFLWS